MKQTVSLETWISNMKERFDGEPPIMYRDDDWAEDDEDDEDEDGDEDDEDDDASYSIGYKDGMNSEYPLAKEMRK